MVGSGEGWKVLEQDAEVGERELAGRAARREDSRGGALGVWDSR